MKEGYYKIVMDKLLLTDQRFDDYRRESMDLFADIQGAISFDNSVSNQEKAVLSKLSQQLVLTDEECHTLEEMNKRFSDSGEKIKKLEIAIENCRHKSQSVRYSLSLIENEINNPLFPNGVLPITLGETEFLNDVVLFEFESFLFQIYSSLDILIYLIALFYPCLNYDKNGKALQSHQYGFKGDKNVAGGRIIKKLEETGENDLANFFNDRVKLWIQDVHRLRNDVAHRSKIQKMQLFTRNNITGNVTRPSFEDGRDLLEYCLLTQQNLITLFRDISKDFLLPKAKDF